jgi:excisionase family DNA binding protein
MTDTTIPSFSKLPRYTSINTACDILGFGRSKLYELAGEGSIRIVKVGGRSLVDIEAALAWMATLPVASIAPLRKAAQPVDRPLSNANYRTSVSEADT